jgi:hypothetical protein
MNVNITKKKFFFLFLFFILPIQNVEKTLKVIYIIDKKNFFYTK